ncbi:hypothetical protein [Catellatospora tritici]|uniref:hypothetical protein n=1 Tax=Catellatospora tritici TaxID=2851566 RepID=UPI001C2D67F2|nr:hypothetical protein [Catellatospora tritici]MBV1850749.1 hypothetical protein [Catellatospora tritici]MBV1851002.1 hypothetical protein [Catellatospora tritici]
MARRAPARVRADLPRRRQPGERVPLASNISARGLAEIARLERLELRPGAVFEALRGWERFTHADDARRVRIRGCGESGCCPDPLTDRLLLDRVLPVLPPADARSLRQRIDAMDSRIHDWQVITWPWS